MDYQDYENYQNPEHPWDDSVYGTGPMEPPKSHSGLLALLLILVIFLCGIITVLGILNIRLFKQLNLQEESYLSVAAVVDDTAAEAAPLPEEVRLPQDTESVPAHIDLQESPLSVDNIPVGGSMPLQDIYQKNIASVVSIICSGQGSNSTGTGVIVSEEGYIVTNAHVVDRASAVSVQLMDDRVFSASLVGADEISDLAVLLISAEDLVPVQFGDSNALRVGDTVAAIGDPLGMEFRGTFTDSAGVEGLGFAIPSATVKDIVEQIISQGYVSGRPTLGIQGEALSNFYQRYYRLPAGLYITDVKQGSYADYYGIEPGDLLLQVDDTRILGMEDLNSVLYRHQVGDTVTVIIYRGGQQASVELLLTEDKG